MPEIQKTIIIADNTKIVRDLTQTWLERVLGDNYNYDHITSGKALEKMFSTGVGNSALAIIDNKMPPGKTGSEIIEEYGKNVKFPIIFHYDPSEVGKEVGEQALQNGARAYFLKPKYEEVALKAKEILEGK